MIKPKGIDSGASEITDTLVKSKVKDLDASIEIKDVKASVKPDEILDKKNVKVSDDTVPNNTSEVESLGDKAKS